MADPIFGALGQGTPVAATKTAIYTVPDGRRAVARVYGANAGALTTIGVAHAVDGAADSPEQYVIPDGQSVSAYGVALTPPLALGAGDVIRCVSASGNVSFNVNGIEQDA